MTHSPAACHGLEQAVPRPAAGLHTTRTPHPSRRRAHPPTRALGDAVRQDAPVTTNNQPTATADGPSSTDGPDFDAMYCARWRGKGRYELVCGSIKADIAEQLTARSRRVCAARYKGAVDRLLHEVEDAINADSFGGAA